MTDSTDTRKAWQAGQQAAQERQTKADNPYEPFSRLRYIWDQGYESATGGDRVEEAMRRIRGERDRHQEPPAT